MPVYYFVWLSVILVLSCALTLLSHRRKVAIQVEKGIAAATDILDSSTEGLITTNSSGEIIKFNRAAESIFGYKADYVTGKNFLLLLSEEAHETHRHIMSGSNSKTVSQSLEIMACRSDGTRFPSALTIKPIQGEGLGVFLGMFRDISARKLAEVNSQKSQQFMEFLLQSSAAVFYTCDVKHGTNINYVSPNVERLLGYKPETITGTAAFWSRHVHPDDHDHIQTNRISRTKDTRENLEYRLKFADGSYRWIADSRIMVNDRNGEPVLLIGCWTDINEKRRAEVNLAVHEERLRIGLKCAKLATWDWDINTGKIAWSGDVHEKLGLEEKLAINFDDFCATTHPEDHELLQSAFRQCLVQDKSLDIEYRIVWPDKSIHWIHLAGDLINDEIGGPVRMVGALSDVSEQKQLRVAQAPGLRVAS